MAKTDQGKRVISKIHSGSISKSKGDIMDASEDGDDEGADPAGCRDGDDDEYLGSSDDEAASRPRRRKKRQEKDLNDKFDQDEAFDELVSRLQLGTSRKFKDADLERDDIIQLGLQLAYKKRLGAENSSYRKSTHIRYHKISVEMQEVLEKKMSDLPKDIKRD